MQLKLSGSGKNHLEVAINHHAASKSKSELEKLIHRWSQNIPLPSRTDKKHQTLYRTTKSQNKNYNNHAKIATPILTWQESSGNRHNQLPGSKWKQKSNNQLTDQTKPYQNPPEQTRSMKHLTEPSWAISNLAKTCKYSYIDPKMAKFIYNWPEPSCSI